MKQYEKEWLDNIRLTSSQHTQRAYQQDLKQFLYFLCKHFGHSLTIKNIQEISVQDVRSWLSSRKQHYEIKSTVRAFSSVKNFFDYLLMKQYIHQSPFHNMRPPKIGKSLPKALSEEQVFDLIQNINDSPIEWINLRDQALLMILYSIGLRVQEALNLNQNILGESSLYILGKGNKERSLPLLENVKQKIQEYLVACPYQQNKNAPLFYSFKGKRLSQGIIQKTIKKYRDFYNLPDYMTPHALRHSCATHLIDKTDNLRAIQDLLGHQSLSTTQIYTKISAQKIRQDYDKGHPLAKKS